ncbi:hypothetical protein WJX81_005964 [Elliptochloris bilobata]|uniref:UV radiation resistance-associated gene protein n=1 Tax=Elliptochloris bilobata TaxID=381761 RepID=A0AAW1R3I2_9CHLO
MGPPAPLAAACCEAAPCGLPPGAELIAAASVDLEWLQALPDGPAGGLAALDDAQPLPPNTLVLELGDGLYVHPRLALKPLPPQRSSSPAPGSEGACAGAPEPAGIRNCVLQSFLRRPLFTPDSAGEDAAPRAGRAVEEAEAPRVGSLAAGGRDGGLPNRAGRTVQVEAADLEAGLVALVQVQAALTAADARRCELLRALSQAVEVRAGARKQAADLAALRERGAAALQAAEAAATRAGVVRRGAARGRRVLNAQACALLAAARTLQGAERRCGGNARRLEVEVRGGRLARLQRLLVARRCGLAAALGRVYALAPRTVAEAEPPPSGYPWDAYDRLWFQALVLQRIRMPAVPDASSPAALEPPPAPASEAASDSGSRSSRTSRMREVVRMTIGGLELCADVGRHAGEAAGWGAAERAAAAAAAAGLGAAARLAALMAALLDVPLRYPIRFAGSRSSMLEHPPPAARPALWDEEQSSDGGRGVGALEFPLYCSGAETTRFAYAVFLLSKDVEQLLHAHGLSAVGPHQLLPNLHKLLAAAASASPVAASTRSS